MAASKASFSMPIISKMYCSSSQVILWVRRRPHVVGGGGLVITDCNQRVVFRVDGCGIIGKRGELMLRDHQGEPILLIRQKGGIVQALSVQKKWKSYSYEYQGLQKLVFSVKEPSACFSMHNSIRISTESKGSGWHSRDWDFQIKGYFPDRDCTIVDRNGDIIAQVGVKEEIEKMMKNKDLYHVVVKAGMDQAFVFGVIAVLDYIHHQSTSC